VDRILARAGEFLSEHGVIFIELGNSQAALENKYDFLPMTWIEFEFGGGGVCAIQAQDLQQQQTAIIAVAG
jgi:ribosomal protein L3 glutamine methyltransferase